MFTTSEGALGGTYGGGYGAGGTYAAGGSYSGGYAGGAGGAYGQAASMHAGGVQGMHVAGPAGGAVHAGGMQAGGMHMVGGQEGLAYSGGAGVGMNPGYGVSTMPSQPGCCDVGSNCCGGGVGSGVTVVPGPGGGATVLPAPGVDAGGACCVGGPDVACGGAGSACCEPAGAMVTSTGWAFVGAGRGDFSPTPSYNYVGQGAGSYVKEVNTTFYGWKLRPCCIALLLLGLLLPLLFYLLNSSGGSESVDPVDPVVPVPSPAPVPQTPTGVCTIFGDPHVLTFDGMRADYYSPGEYYIVKSNTIIIQGRYLPTKITSGLGVTKIVAIGGPLMKGHKCFISADWAKCDNQNILTGFPSSFEIPGVISMQYNGQGQLLQKGRQGMQLHVVHIKIEDGTAEGIQLQINRWTKDSEGHYINTRITMHKQPGQDGHCGNFNGNAADDDRVQVRSRLGKNGVPPSELLFATKTPVVQVGQPNINDCEAETLDKAKAHCSKKEGKLIPSMGCLVDCCFASQSMCDEDSAV